MNTIGLGNALVDVLLKLENDDVLAEVGIQKGAMDMINQEQMIKIRKSQSGLERSQALNAVRHREVQYAIPCVRWLFWEQKQDL